MSELNREQIIKALECCVKAETHLDCRKLNCPALINDECIYIGEDDRDCDRQQFADALALIKELIEENERLNKIIYEANESMKEANNSLRVIHTGVVNLIAENERLRADTVREMCQRIKEYFPYDADSGLYVVLDQIAKEMLEGEK